MQLRNGVPTDILCAPNEPITITIVEHDTARIVSNNLDGATLAANNFQAGAQGSVRSLIVSLGFSGNQLTGRYDVTLTGNGPDTSFLPVHEPPPPKLQNVPYTITAV